MDRTRMLGATMGITRAGVGAALTAAPGWAGRIWLGDAADSPTGRVLARSVGARDVAIGAATLAALGGRRSTTQLLTLGFANGIADALATALAARHLDARRRIAMPAVAAAVAGAGILATAWARAADDADGGAGAPGPTGGAADEATAGGDSEAVELPVGAAADTAAGAPFFA